MIDPVETGAIDAGVSPRFAGVRIRDVDLDDGPVERGERIVDRPGVVGERAGVDDDRRAPPAGVVDVLDQLALVVRLVRLDREPVRSAASRANVT